MPPAQNLSLSINQVSGSGGEVRVAVLGNIKEYFFWVGGGGGN